METFISSDTTEERRQIPWLQQKNERLIDEKTILHSLN